MNNQHKGAQASQKLLSAGDYLKKNRYPGRGIIFGRTPSGRLAAAYFIMGRSANSRNRIFSVKEPGSLYTQAFDPEKVEDPSLILYRAAARFPQRLIITNGDQTDTIYQAFSEGRTAREALQTRCFEPDEPNYTPRISGVATYTGSDFTYELSILKSSDEKGNGCERFFFSYPSACGVGHLIHTYEGDGQPLPAFTGEPRKIVIPEGLGTLTEELWQALDEENKVSLFVIQTNPDGSDPEVRIINKNQK